MFETPSSNSMIMVSKGKTVFVDALLKVNQIIFLMTWKETQLWHNSYAIHAICIYKIHTLYTYTHIHTYIHFCGYIYTCNLRKTKPNRFKVYSCFTFQHISFKDGNTFSNLRKCKIIPTFSIISDKLSSSSRIDQQWFTTYEPEETLGRQEKFIPQFHTRLVLKHS